MKKLLLFMGLLLTAVMPLWAGHVTEQEALQKARRFMQDKQFADFQTLRRAAAATDLSSGAFYVFNADGRQGFVIVSADDRTEPILGYSDQGSLDMENLPENAKAWLESYARQLAALDGGATAVVANTPMQPIAPLLASKWGQDEPYSLLTPMDTNKEGKLVHSVTGCAATAMAQLMYYHKLPTATAIPAYTTESRNFNMPQLPATTFNWDIIKAVYDNNASEESRQEVAKLMLYCGQSIKMNYTADASDATPTATAFVTYFGYSKQAREVDRGNYTHTEWDQLMYDELASNRPILYYGDGTTGAHEFVVDGCDAQGLFHINWGWNGESDGYFVLSIANSNTPGITGSLSAQGFDTAQSAIIGLQKAQEGDQAPMGLVVYYPSLDKPEMTYTRDSASDDFKDVKLTFFPAFLVGSPQENVDYAAAIYAGSQCVAIEPLAENVATKDNFIPVTKNINISSTFSGDYQVRLLSRRSGTTQWQPSAVYDDPTATPVFYPQCLCFTIEGNTLTMSLKTITLSAENTKINSVSFSKRPMAGRALTATINWTCLNLYNATYFYIFFEGSNKYAGKVSAYQSYGETANVDIVFTPKVTGERKFYITADEIGKQEYYSGTLTIAAPQQHNLTAAITIGGQSATEGTEIALNTTSFSGTTTLKNNGTQTYDDFVCVRLYKKGAGEQLVGDPVMRNAEINLAPGAEATLSFNFDNLEKGEKYYLMVQYYTKSNAEAGNWDGEEKEAGSAHLSVSAEATAVQSVRATTAAACEYYTIDGHRLAQPQRGLNIVRMPDGTTRKFVKR